jgi:hypothetical protein
MLLRLDEWQRYIDSEFVAGKAADVGARQPDTGAPGVSPGADAEDAAAAARVAGEVAPSEVLSPSAADGLAATAEQPADRVTDSAEAGAQPIPAARGEDAMPTGVQAGTIEPSIGTQSEMEIAPFADYIAVRRQPSEAPPTLDLEYAADETATASVAGAAPDPAQRSALLVDTNDGDGATPLTASIETAVQLRLVDSLAPSDADVSARQRREALIRRLCDPVLSVDDAALLLGVPAETVRAYAGRDGLKTCEPPGGSPRGSSGSRRAAKEQYFRLSDIVAFLTAKRAAREA